MEMTWPAFWILFGLFLDALAFLILAHDLVQLTKKLPGWEMADRQFLARTGEALKNQSETNDELKALRAEYDARLAQGTETPGLDALRADLDVAVRTLAAGVNTVTTAVLEMTELFRQREHTVANRKRLTFGRAWLAAILFVIGVAMQGIGLLLTV